MKSLILRATARFLLPLMLLFSVFLFLRGHNEPGGGFVAGLVAAGGYILYAMAYGVGEMRSLLWLDPRAFIGLGLAGALTSALWPTLAGKPLFTGLWVQISLGPLGKLKLGTPLLFDLGVYAAVFGVMLTIVVGLMEE